MEALDSIPVDAETRLQLFHRSADLAEAADGHKHHLHSHEDYLEEFGHTHRLHDHDEYLKDLDADVSESTADDEKVRRRCVWGKNCPDICAQGGVAGFIGCTWNCGGDADTPMCPE